VQYCSELVYNSVRLRGKIEKQWDDTLFKKDVLIIEDKDVKSAYSVGKYKDSEMKMLLSLAWMCCSWQLFSFSSGTTDID
jgi:hypothetical protein